MKKTAAKKKAPTKRGRPAKKTGVKPVEKDESKQGGEIPDDSPLHWHWMDRTPDPADQPESYPAFDIDKLELQKYKAIALELGSLIEDIENFAQAIGSDPARGGRHLCDFIEKHATILDKYFDANEDLSLHLK